MALTYQAAVEQTITAGEQIHQIVNGTATTEVTVEDGSKVPSIRKALLDNFYFKDPIVWQVGQTENVFNQLRKFTDGSWWYAPSATASNPISMGSTPVGDPLWKIYDFDAIGKLTPQLREALRRSYAEAGYNLVDGSFEAGGTLVNANDVLLQERTGKAFSGPAGPVAAGTTPASGGFVDRSQTILRQKAAVYGTVADIASGVYEVGSLVTVTDRDMAVFTITADGVPNGYWKLDAGQSRIAVLSESDPTLRMFGAIGDGVSDDTASIQSAIDSGWKRIICGAGKFKISSLTLKSGLNLIGASPATEFESTSSTVFVAAGGGVMLVASSHIRRMNLQNILFSGGGFAPKFLTAGGFGGGGSSPDLSDCSFKCCAWNGLLDVFDKVVMLRCFVEDYYINNCTTANTVFWIRGADSYVGKGFIGCNPLNPSQSAVRLGYVSYIWVTGMYISSFSANHCMHIENSINLWITDCIFDICNEAGLYIQNCNGPIYLNRPKFGYNNLVGSSFKNGIVSIFDSKNVFLTEGSANNQTVDASKAPRPTVNGLGFIVNAGCSNINISNFLKDPLYVNPDSFATGTTYNLSNKFLVKATKLLTYSTIPSGVTTVNTDGVYKILMTYSDISARQYNLDKTAPLGSIIKIENKTPSQVVIATTVSGVLTTLNPNQSSEFIYAPSDWTVY